MIGAVRMRKATKRIFITVALVLLAILLPSSAVGAGAMLTATESSQIQAMLGERTYGDGAGIVLTNSSTVANALDWLDTFTTDEVGYVREYTNDLLQMIELIKDKGTTVPPDLGRIQSAFTDIFHENADLNTKVSYFQTKLSYNFDRMDFLLSYVNHDEVAGAYALQLSDEMRELKAETENLIGELATAQQNYQAAAQDMQTKMQIQADVQIVRDAAKPILTKEAKAYADAEIGFVSANNETDIQVLSTKEIAVKLVDKQKDVAVEMWRANDANQTSKKTVRTDERGVAIFWISDFAPNADNEVEVAIRISGVGMRTREVQKITMKGAYSTWLKLEKDDGKPYMTMLCMNGKDILSKENTIFVSKRNLEDQKLSFRMDTKGQACKIQIRQHNWGWVYFEYFNKTIAAGDSNLYEVNTKWYNQLRPDKDLEVLITYSNGQVVHKTMLKAKKGPYEEPIKTSTAPQFSPKFSMKIPGFVPIIGGGTVAFPLPTDKLMVYVDLSGTIFLGYGKEIKEIEKVSWKSQDSEDRSKYQKELKKQSVKNKFLYEAKTAKKEFNETNPKFFGERRAAFSAYFYAMLARDSKTGRNDGGFVVGVNFAFTYEATFKFNAGPVPVFIGFDFAAGFGIGREFKASMVFPGFHDWKVALGEGYTANLFLNIGITAGAGIPKIAYIKIRGGFSFVITFTTKYQKPPAHLTVGLSVDLELKIIFFSKSWNLWKWSYSHDLLELQDRLVDTGVAIANAAKVQPDVMDLDQYPYFEDVVAAIQKGVLVLTVEEMKTAAPRPESYFASIPNLGAVDTNVQIVGHDSSRLHAFFIAKVKDSNQNVVTRLCWVSLNDTKVNGVAHTMEERSGLFDYDFDIAYLSGNYAIVLLSGTRIGVKELGSNATNDERAAELEKARRQTRICIQLFGPDGNGLKQKTGFPVRWTTAEKSKRHAFSLPRISGLKNPGWNPQKGTKSYDAAIGFAYTLYDPTTGKTPTYTQIATNFMNWDAPVFRYDSWMVQMSIPYGQYAIHDMALFDQGIQRSDGAIIPPVALILHSQTNQPDMAVVLNKDVGSMNDLKNVFKQEGTFKSIRPIRVMGAHNYVTEGAFVTQDVRDSSGNPLTRLSAIWQDAGRQNGDAPDSVKLNYIDYGVEVAADGVDTVSIGEYKDKNRQLYAYWPQSIEDGDNGKRYTIRAVLVDGESRLMTPPFTLLELDEIPLKSTMISKTAADTVFAYLGTKNKGLDAPVGLYGVKAPLKTGIALESVVADDQVIGIGDPLELTIRVKNTGNLVVEKFKVALSANGKQFAVVDVNAQNDKDNTVELFNNSGVSVRQAKQEAAFRLPGTYDQYNGETEVVTVGTFSGSGPVIMGAPTTKTIKGFLPGNTRIYSVQVDQTPEDWKEIIHLKAEIIGINSTLSLTGTEEEGMVQYEVDVKTGTATEFTTQAAGAPAAQGISYNGYQKPLDAAGNALDSVGIDLKKNDQTLEATVEYIDGEPYAVLNLGNYSNDFAKDHPALLIATIEGQEVYRHQFVKALSGQYGYSVKIPLTKLTGGQPFEEVKVRLTAAGNQEEYGELDPFDNEAILAARANFTILGPDSLTRFEGEGAIFEVTVDGNSGPYSYQWQYRNPNGTWENLVGETGPTLALGALSLSDHGKVFWCVVYDRNGQGKMSPEAVLTVIPRDVPPATGDPWPLESLIAVAVCATVALAGYLLWRRRKLKEDA